MNANIKKLPKSYYFSCGSLPVTLKWVKGCEVSHLHDYTAIPHWHDFSELVIITSGTGIQKINEQVYPVSAGDVFVIMDQTTHCFLDYQNLEIINVMFTQDLFRGMQEYLNRIPGYNLIFHYEPRIRNRTKFKNMLHLSASDLVHVSTITNRIRQEFESENAGFEASALSMTLELIVFLSRQAETKSVSGYTISRIACVISSLDADFKSAWDLKRMAKLAGMSVNNFLRIFHTVTGQTPLQYLTDLRMNAAGSFLLHSGQSVAETGYACGYQDSNYFTKKFTARFKMSPTQYRKAYQKLYQTGGLPEICRRNI